MSSQRTEILQHKSRICCLFQHCPSPLPGCRNPPAKLSGAQGCSADLQSVPSADATHRHEAACRHRVCRMGHGESVDRVVVSQKKKVKFQAFLLKQRIVLCPLYLSCSALSYALKQLQTDQAN